MPVGFVGLVSRMPRSPEKHMGLGWVGCDGLDIVLYHYITMSLADTMSLAELKKRRSPLQQLSPMLQQWQKLPRLHTRVLLKDWLDTRLVIVRYGDHLLPDCRLKSRKDSSYW